MYKPAFIERLISGLLSGLLALSGGFARSFRAIGHRPAFLAKGTPAHRPERMGAPYSSGIVRALRLLLAILLLTAALPLWASAATKSGTAISSTARISYYLNSALKSGYSNTVSHTVDTITTRAVITLLEYAPDDSDAQSILVRQTEYLTSASGSYAALPAPTLAGATGAISLSSSLPLAKTELYHMGDPIFITLEDSDQNLDPTLEETVLVTISASLTGDTEILRLKETGPDTGLFAGYIQSGYESAMPYDGSISLSADDTVKASYTDSDDTTDDVEDTALVDPSSLVFDSHSGLPVNGIAVTLLNADTGQPATVYGDDTISIFPSTVESGGTVTDSSGRTYDFGEGTFRFPYIPAGSYKFSVATTSGYIFPSTMSDEDLQKLPGGPFNVTGGSRGERFSLAESGSQDIDIPVDPGTGSLYVRKEVSAGTAAIGDFLKYTVTIEETSGNDIGGVVLTDRLPLGFRYQNGSARIDGAVAPDPSISEDGRTLTFEVGTVPGSGEVVIDYVVEVSAGAHLGKAENSAYASSGRTIKSNVAVAIVIVKEDLFRSTTFIVGRVLADNCGLPTLSEAKEKQGVAGVRILLEDGTFVITDEKGLYHIEGVAPGTHVLQLDTITLPSRYRPADCDINTSAGTSTSRFVDLQGGTLWREDFHLALYPRSTGQVRTELNSKLIANIAEYTLPIHVGTVALSNTKASVILPPGTAYIKGSSRIDGNQVADPAIQGGVVLNYSIGGMPAGKTVTLRFEAALSPSEGSETLATRAVLIFDTPAMHEQRSPVMENTILRVASRQRLEDPELLIRSRFSTLSADLTDADKKIIDDLYDELRDSEVLYVSVFGHTDTRDVKLSGGYRNNYDLSRARADVIAKYIMDKFKLTSQHFAVIGMGEDYPIASNDTEEGHTKNRRVEIRMKVRSKNYTERYSLKIDRHNSGEKIVDVEGEHGGLKDEAPAPELEKYEAPANNALPEYSKADVEGMEYGLAWLSPEPDFFPSLPTLSIAVRHDPRRKLVLLVNGTEALGLFKAYTVTSEDKRKGVSGWRTLPLEKGANKIEAVEYSQFDGKEVQRITREVYYTDRPVSVTLVSDHSVLIADGRTAPVIALRFADANGRPARRGLVGQYTVTPPHQSYEEYQENLTDPLGNRGMDKPHYFIASDGIAYIKLRPTNKSGNATLNFNVDGRNITVNAWLNPHARDWILVGLAEGTLGYNVVNGNMESVDEAGVDDNLFENGRIALYAKGRIKGQWLMTIAYDTSKPDTSGYDMYDSVDPNTYYTLYGDAAQQGKDAQSSKKLYLKIERDKFYALFGDYDTALTATSLSRYTRNLTGLKSEYKSDTFEYSVFASDTNQAFVRDEMAGDGTSGLYYLSRQNIVSSSDSVSIEIRDRYQPDVIVNTTTLSRHTDYTIDYEEGTMYFKEPIPPTDDEFNPVYIVVKYESYDNSDTTMNYGGRAAVSTPDGRVKTGATIIRQASVGTEGNLYGVDTNVKVNDSLSIRAEAAKSDGSSSDGSSSQGSAYLIEASRTNKPLEGKVYLRTMDEDFGLGQNSESELGMRTIGFESSYKGVKGYTFTGKAYRQSSLSSDETSDLAEARASFKADKSLTLYSGLRHAVEDSGDSGQDQSEQILAGASWISDDSKLTLKLDHEQSVLGYGDNSDYPTRTTLSTQYKLSERVMVTAAEQLEFANEGTSDKTTVGLKLIPWAGGEVNSSTGYESTVDSERLYTSFGLKQNYKASDRWTLNAGLDRSDNITGESDTDNYTAYTAGANYTHNTLRWNNRAEVLTSDSYDKTAFVTNVSGRTGDGVGLAAGFTGYRTAHSSGDLDIDAELTLGYAYRPLETVWIILDRLDIVYERQREGESDDDTWKIVNNLNANRKVSERWQLSLQYGAKYVKQIFDDEGYTGYTDLTGGGTRYFIDKFWDVGARLSVLHSWNSDQTDYVTGVSVGRVFDRNIWISVGINFHGFKDEDFSRSNYTSQGPFVQLRFKFDQNSAEEAVRWLTGTR